MNDQATQTRLGVAAMLVPLFWYLSTKPVSHVRFSTVWSVLVAVAGSYWLLERLGYLSVAQ